MSVDIASLIRGHPIAVICCLPLVARDPEYTDLQDCELDGYVV